MKFTLTNIDPEKCSFEELESEIARLSKLKDEKYNKEQSIKVFINSIYGALASPYFVGYNINAAEAVTLQGQDMIMFTNKILDDYFLNQWHLDYDTHKKMGLVNVKPIDSESLVIYNDTDSTYLTFKPVIDSCQFEGSEVDFIIKLRDIKIDAFLNEKFTEYATSFNTKNVQALEMEKISYSALMLQKKKYILNIAWTDSGIKYDNLSKIKPTGIEIIQSSTPVFCRKILKNMIYLIFEEGKSLKYGDVVEQLRKYKNEFKMQDPNNIAIGKSIGDYDKYILEDKNSVKLASKCPINVRAAGIYNHNLLNSKYKTKYNLLKTSDKLKYYYAIGQHDVFGFIPGNYPMEFAYPINYDLQFEKTVIEPLNRYLSAIGFNKIPSQLMYAQSLF
jgi:DNA polymerase elongation subunit (family B)